MRLGFGVLFQHHGQRPPLPVGTRLSLIRGCSPCSLCRCPASPALHPCQQASGLGWLCLETRQAWDFTGCWAEGGSLHPMQGRRATSNSSKGRGTAAGKGPRGEPSWWIEDPHAGVARTATLSARPGRVCCPGAPAVLERARTEGQDLMSKV